MSCQRDWIQIRPGCSLPTSEFGEKKFRVGGKKFRVGRVTLTTHIVFLALLRLSADNKSKRVVLDARINCINRLQRFK